MLTFCEHRRFSKRAADQPALRRTGNGDQPGQYTQARGAKNNTVSLQLTTTRPFCRGLLAGRAATAGTVVPPSRPPSVVSAMKAPLAAKMPTCGKGRARKVKRGWQ